MSAAQPPSDGDRELNDLRARAYGRDHDIEADPAALARLVELENARVSRLPARPETDPPSPAAGVSAATASGADAVEPASDHWDAAPAEVPEAGSEAAAEAGAEVARAAPSPAGFWRSLWRRATATRSRRILFAAASAVLVVLVASVATWIRAVAPDATLRPLADQPDDRLISLMGAIGLEADITTLQKYEPYRDLEPWSVMETRGYLCLMAVDAGRGGIYNTQCVPPGTELFVNLGVWPEIDDPYGEGLPAGSVIRWHLRDDAVEVFVYPASGGD